MNKFYKWMFEKGYGYRIIEKDKTKLILTSCIDDCESEFTEKMLIGYMIEYIMQQYDNATGWKLQYMYKKLEKIIFSKSIYEDLSFIINEID